MRRIPSRLLGIACIVIALGGCASFQCGKQAATPSLLAVWHSGGGPAPVVSSILITGDRGLVYRTPRGRVRCGQLDPKGLRAIVELTSSEEFQRAVRDAEKRGAGYADYEELEIKVGDSWSVRFPMELASVEALRLLELLGESLRTHVGRPAPWSGDWG